MSTKIYKLPDGIIRMVCPMEPSYPTKLGRGSLIAMGEGIFDEVTKVVRFKLMGSMIPIPIVGDYDYQDLSER